MADDGFVVGVEAFARAQGAGVLHGVVVVAFGAQTADEGGVAADGVADLDLDGPGRVVAYPAGDDGVLVPAADAAAGVEADAGGVGAVLGLDAVQFQPQVAAEDAAGDFFKAHVRVLPQV